MRKPLIKLAGYCLIALMGSCGSSGESTTSPPSTTSPSITAPDRAWQIEDSTMRRRSRAYAKYPDTCKDVQHQSYCGTGCQSAIALCHKISVDSFNNMIDTFSKVGKRYSGDSIQTLLTNANATCANHWIRVKAEHALPDGKHNRDIMVEPLSLDPDQKMRPTPRRFSTAMFMGLLNRGVDSMVFYKAHQLDCTAQDGSCDDYVIRVKFKNAGTPQEYYDISDIPPPGWDQ